MKLYVVRHGESESNRDKRFSGWSQVHLTEQGRRDAQRAGEMLAGLHFDRVYASDLQRALETAQVYRPRKRPQSELPKPEDMFRNMMARETTGPRELMDDDE